MTKTYKVYMHTTPNGKKYIGYTGQSLKSRWGNGTNYKQHKQFYNAILKYGWDNIKHEILFETDNKEEALQKEMYYIELYKSNLREFGYNSSIGGESGFNGGHHSKNTIERIKKKSKLNGWAIDNLSKSVAQYSLDGELIAIYPSITIASLSTGITRGTITRNCTNILTKPLKFFWIFYDENNHKDKIDIETKIKPRKNILLFTYSGKTKTVREWAKEYNINYLTLLQRLSRNKMPIEKALTMTLDVSKINKKYKKLEKYGKGEQNVY